MPDRMRDPAGSTQEKRENVIDGDAPQPDETDIIGGVVQIDASGDIGSKEDPLDVESDEFGATGGNIHIASQGDVLVDRIVGKDVSISSGGKVTDKDGKDAIIADSLTIDAAVVGEEKNPLNINVPREPVIDAEYGYINMVNCWQYRTLIDEPTGVQVPGWMYGKTELLVSYDFEHERCLVCNYLQKLPVSLVLARYYLSMTGVSNGMLYVQIPVDEDMEGQIVTIAYCDDGKLITIQVQVKDGFVSFFVDELHNFVILDGQYHVVVEGNQ